MIARLCKRLGDAQRRRETVHFSYGELKLALGIDRARNDL